MSDELIELAFQRSEAERADRIAALEAALAKADALAESLSLQRSAQGNSVSPRTALALAAYREARKPSLDA